MNNHNTLQTRRSFARLFFLVLIGLTFVGGLAAATSRYTHLVRTQLNNRELRPAPQTPASPEGWMRPQGCVFPTAANFAGR